MDISQIKAVVESSTAKPTKARTQKVTKATELKGKKLEAKEKAIIKGVAQMKSKGVKYMLENALNSADKWTILDITYTGKAFKDNEGNERISQADGVVFQNVEKGFLRKVVPR